MPGKVIAVFNEKGGAGKTTIAAQLADTFGRQGFQVVLADLDPQHTATLWSANAPEGRAFGATVWRGDSYRENLVQQLRALVDKYEILIADCPPSVESRATWTLLQVADLALVPTRLSPPDLAALGAAKRLCQRAFDERGNFPVAIVPNAVRAHLPDDQAYMGALQQDRMFPLAPTLGDRKAYSRAMLNGTSVHGVAGATDARAEIDALATFVLKQLGRPRPGRK